MARFYRRKKTASRKKSGRFFGKKLRKKLCPMRVSGGGSTAKRIKVFCFFFSKKKRLPYPAFRIVSSPDSDLLAIPPKIIRL